MEENLPLQLGKWHAHIPAGGREVVVLDQRNEPVATIHGASFEEVFARARLLAATPELRDAAIAALRVFDAFAQTSTDTVVREAASKDMLPMLASVLNAAGVEVTRRGRGQ